MIAKEFDRHWKENPASGCWEWQRSFGSDGYGQLYIGTGRNCRKKTSAHRFSYERHNGRIPDGLHVCHRCDNKACVNPAHLFLGTNTENRRDSVAKGRAAKGERHGRCKLAVGDVDRIRDIARVGGVSHAEIASHFGISQTQASRIIRGARWAHA